MLALKDATLVSDAKTGLARRFVVKESGEREEMATREAGAAATTYL